MQNGEKVNEVNKTKNSMQTVSCNLTQENIAQVAILDLNICIQTSFDGQTSRS
jgi:hypothetical protein